MRAHAAVFAISIGLAAVGACSSFGAEEDAPDASTADAPDVRDSGLADGADALAPRIRWSFEDSGAASTGDVRDTFFLAQGAGFGQGVVGGGLHCPPTGYAQTAATGTPFEIGAGDATFIVWVKFDANAEDAGDADRYHTFFDRNMNWAASQGKGTGYGLGYAHLVEGAFLQGAVTDSAGNYASVRGPVELFDGAFHMVAFVVSQDALSLYSDGQIRGTAPWTRGNPIGIGPDAGPIRLCDVYSNYLRGSLDELMIFPRALSIDEVKQVALDVQGTR